jgi:hypothetical protein
MSCNSIRRHASLLVLIAIGLLSSPACHAQTSTVVVNADVFVNATGIYIQAGQKVQITATGTVNISDDNGGYFTDPNGTITQAPLPGTGAYNYFTGVAGPAGQPPVVGNQKIMTDVFGTLPGAAFGALVGAFGPDPTGDQLQTWFVIGALDSFTATTSGYLYLSVNDFDNTSNDTGAFSATITILTQPIGAVEFTQAIQQYQSLKDFQTQLNNEAEPLVPIVANKPAVMRIYFSPVSDITTYNVTVTGDVTGSKSKTVWPACSVVFQRAGSALCFSTDFYFTPPIGGWSTTVTVTDNLGNQLEQETFEIISRTEDAINLKGISACTVPGNPLTCQNASALLGLTSLANRVMPTSIVTVDITPQRLAKTYLNYADADAWLSAMVDSVQHFYRPADAAADAAGNMRTDYVAIYNGSVASTGIGGLGGHNVVVPTSAPRLGTEAKLSVLAHEVGHTLGLLHTVLDNPAAINDLAPGCWGAGGALPGHLTNWSYPTDNIQSSMGPEYGFDVRTHSIIDPTDTYELMSYCIPRWFSPINYKVALATLDINGGGVNSPNLKESPGKRLKQLAARPLETPTLVQGQYWDISGSIQAAGVTMDPIFTENIQGSLDPGTGTYSIQAQSSSGAALYTRYFTPLVDTTDTLGTDIITDPQFSEWIPATAGTASIAIVDPNGNVLTSVPLTGVAPKVTITNPVAGFVGTGMQTLTWNVQSAAPTLTARVFYSTDGGTTWLQIDELTGTSDTIDFSTMPGAAAAMFRIDVSDGVNTGSATSVPFSAPKKMPSAILIDTPASGYVQAAVDPVFLSGAAYDPDDGVLTGTALQWSDSAQGVLGTGSPLSVTLNPGPHTITLTGTDSDGNVITASSSITLAGAPPVVTLATSTISQNCVSATINATPGSQGAALSAVQFSFNGGVTNTSIPLTNLPYSFIVPGSSSVNILAVAADLSNQTAAQSAAVTLTGACTTGTPTVSGGSTQMGVVGAPFSAPLTVLVSDLNGNPIAGAAVNFSAPAAGASATFSPASATTAANGIASATATANNVSGSYAVTATVQGISTTAQFNLTNTDFTLALDNSSLAVKHGSSGTATVTIAPLSGFNSAVTLACTGLPTGVTCAFSPASLTPAGSSLTSTLTVTAASDAKSTSTAMFLAVPAGGLMVAFCLFTPRGRRHRRLFTVLMLLTLGVFGLAATGCGGFKTFTSSINVTATSGTLTHTTPISITVQ